MEATNLEDTFHLFISFDVKNKLCLVECHSMLPREVIGSRARVCVADAGCVASHSGLGSLFCIWATFSTLEKKKERRAATFDSLASSLEKGFAEDAGTSDEDLNEDLWGCLGELSAVRWLEEREKVTDHGGRRTERART